VSVESDPPPPPHAVRRAATASEIRTFFCLNISGSLFLVLTKNICAYVPTQKK
jgi:hypothetical protein